jgi:hypothetical protein
MMEVITALVYYDTTQIHGPEVGPGYQTEVTGPVFTGRYTQPEFEFVTEGLSALTQEELTELKPLL